VEPQQYWTHEGFLEGMGREAAGFAVDESWELEHWAFVEDLRLCDPYFFYSVGNQTLRLLNDGRPLEALRSLVIDSALLDDSAFEIITRPDSYLSRLMKLWVRWSEVTDEGVRMLCEPDAMPILNDLNLRHNWLSGESLRLLLGRGTGLCHLVRLCVAQNYLGPAATEFLRHEDSALVNLEALNLGFCGLNHRALMDLAHGDRALPSLHRIGLAGNQISDEDLACFAASGTPLVKRITHLDVSDSPRVSDEMFDLLEGPGQNLTALTRLSLRRNELTDHVLRRMLFPDMFPALRVLDLRGTQVRESSLGELNRHRPRLRVML